MKLAVLKAASGEGIPPYDLLIGNLCDRFHVLPSQVEGEDLPRLLRMVEQVELYSAIRRMQAGEKLSGWERAAVGEVLQWDLEQGE